MINKRIKFSLDLELLLRDHPSEFWKGLSQIKKIYKLTKNSRSRDITGFTIQSTCSIAFDTYRFPHSRVVGLVDVNTPFT